MIDSFRGKYRFLSNFWPCKVVYEGLTYPSSEAAYQAAKTTNSYLREQMFTNIKPGDAKRAGRKVAVRPDWEEVKLQVMYDICKDKFTRHQDLREKLLETGAEELVEGNTWGDRFWGRCNSVGHNHLGKILMRIREELRQSI